MSSDRRVLKLFFINWSIGIALGLLFAGLLLGFDIGRLRTLLLGGDIHIAGLALLFGGFAITFGGVVCGSAVMFCAGNDGNSNGSASGSPEFVPIYAEISRKS